MIWMRSLAFSLFLGGAVACGQTILVDYGDGATSPTLGGAWNTVDSALSGSGLVDTSGAASGVTILFGGDGWIDSANDQGPWPSGDVGWVDADATSDYTFNTGGDSSTVTFAGLTPGGLYNFQHVAARALGTDRIADYTVNGAFADSTPNGDDYNAFFDGWEPGGILVWDAVAASGAGEITLRVDDVQNFGYLSASRLSLVPEPAAGSLLLMAIGGMLVARLKR